MEFKSLPMPNRGPFLEQYLGIWAIEETAFGLLWDRVHSMDLAAHLQTATPKTEVTSSRQKNLVRIDIRGAMTKQGSSLSGAGSTVRIRQEIRAAARDSSIDGILLVIESPGGTAAGTAELGAEIAAAAKQKPVVGFIEDLAASAGYWAASQCTAVYANTPSAWVGSIGTYIALFDYSMAAASAGIKSVVMKTGKYKAAGVPGSEISPEHQLMWQGLVDETQKQFTAAVKSGRNLSAQQLEEVLTAKVFPASEAIGMGLIDGVKSYDQTVAELGKLVTQKRRSAMSDNGFGESIGISEIEAACPGAPAQFVLSQLRSGASAEQAARAYSGLLVAELKSANEKLAQAESSLKELQASTAKEIGELKSQIEGLKSGKGQHQAIPESGRTGNDTKSATDEFNSLVAEKVSSGMSKPEAHAAVVRGNPELTKQMVQERNASR